MNPTQDYTITTNISAMLRMVGEDRHFDEMCAKLANKKKVPLHEFEKFVFDNLDKLAAFYDSEVAKIGRPLTANEFKDILKRVMKEFEKEL